MGKWKGQWLWCSGKERPKNFYLYVRKVVNLPQKPSSAPVRVCADSRYKLVVNGKLIGRGPTRSFPEYQHYDEYDLAKDLKKGDNVITALVHHFGENTFQYHLGPGGFLFDAQVKCGGKSINMGTDETWKVLPATAWYRDIPRIVIQLGFQEIYDMNQAPEGWTELDFDDSTWQDATVVGPVGTPPWKLIPRDIPYLPESQIYPAGVLETGAADFSKIKMPKDDPMNISLLQKLERRDNTARGLFTNVKSLVRCPNVEDLLASSELKPGGESAAAIADRCKKANSELKDITVKPSPDGRSSYVALDFGREVMGYVTLKIKSNSGGIIDLGYSEMLEDGIVNAHRNDVRYADRVILKPSAQEFETYDKRAFRYMQLDFRDLKGPVVIESVGLKFSTYPVKWAGSFESSDDLLNNIWKTSAYTVQLNMEDAYTDCPWRERAQWWGDAKVEILCNFYAFGDSALAKQGLTEMARSQHEDGITACFAPGDKGPCGPIPGFTLIWILSVWDYYLFTADKNLVAKLYPNVKKALNWFTSRIGDMGLATHLPYWMFIDWADMDLRGAVTSLNCFLVGALNAASEMAKIAGKEGDAKRYTATAAKLADAINEHLFDTRRFVYADCHCDGELSRVVSEQTNSLAVYYDVAPSRMHNAILDYIHDPENEVVHAGSPYFSFYVLQALWKAGQKDRAFNYIRTKWGNMLAQDATTCWEHWHQGHSLCHGWSGGPAMDLPAQVLGIRPLSPAFARFEVAPEMFDLEWAKGTVPTPRGMIEVSWERSDKPRLDIVVPRTSTAVVTLPQAVDANEVSINGKKTAPEGIEQDEPANGRPVYIVKGKREVSFKW